MKYFKIIILILIQAFLVMNAASAGGLELAKENKAIKSTLSPQIAIDHNVFKLSYSIYTRKRFLGEGVVLPEGLISDLDINENGTIINKKTTNFKIGKNSFRVPPYLSGRVTRLHITAIDQNGFEFQKMDIGGGRRKKTIAVVLVDLANQENQLLVFGQDDTALLKALDQIKPEETIKLGNKAQFDAMARQDSFLERSDLGIDFLNKTLKIGQSKFTKPHEVAAALKNLAISNPGLETKMPVNLAFFFKDYIMTFSENLKRHSYVAVLRDREHGGRFIAVVDRLNSDNRVVFERRGEDIYILGENERLIISKLKKHEKAQVINFTDIEEGARFYRNVTRNLVEIDFHTESHSISIRKKVQLNVGAHTPGVSALKVPQVTQATFTGYQIKKRELDLMEEAPAVYPVYILRDDFQREVSVDDVKIDFDSVRFMFFNVGDIEKWPHYLSFDNAENAGYYQHLKGSYAHKGQDYVVYRSITKPDILTSLSFSNDGSFTIKGINWKDGKSVVFRNIKNIALSNIVTQLNSSRFINVDPLLDQYFNVFGFEPGQNPRRSTYIFKKGMFEQGTTLKMNELIDFTEIQKKQDRKIACHNILGSKILSDFFTRDQLKGKVKGNRHLAYFIRRLLITNNKTIINVMEKVDVHSEDWITEQNKKLLKKFNAHSENKGSKKADTWTDLADTPTSGLGDLYKLLAHSIGTAYNYMGVFMKLPQENEEYEKVRELLEKTLNDAYINLRSIEIESNHNSLPGEAKTNLLFDKVNIPGDYLKKNLLVEFSPQNVFLIGQSI